MLPQTPIDYWKTFIRNLILKVMSCPKFIFLYNTVLMFKIIYESIKKRESKIFILFDFVSEN